MKIVHLCTIDYGGAGIAAYRLHKGLLSIGIDSVMLVLSKKNDDETVKVIPDYPLYDITPSLSVKNHQSDFLNTKWSLWRNLDKIYPNRPNGVDAFSEVTSEIDISKVKEIMEADIINLHWVAGLLNYDIELEFLRDKKLVWTLHDMNPFTGGCHYTGDCSKYKTLCYKCPQLGSNEEKDLSLFNWTKKKQFYENINIEIVTPSKWLGRCASESKLLGKFNTTVIPYSFPTEDFIPNNKNQAKKDLKIPVDKKLVLFGVAYKTERKGLKYLLDAINNLDSEKYPDVIIGLFGLPPAEISGNKKNNFIQFGYIKDIKLLAKIYSAADVFILPALEDNLPNTVIESMSCGTPVVGFDTGGIPDMIVHKHNGFLAKYKDSGDLLNGILWVLYDADYSLLCSNSRRTAVESFKLNIQAERYLNLYNELLLQSHDYETKESDIISKELEELERFYIERKDELLSVKIGSLLDSYKYSSKVILAISEIFIQENELELAEIILENVNENNSQNVSIQNNLAVVKIMMNKLDTAEEILKNILRIESNNETAIENLKYLNNTIRK